MTFSEKAKKIKNRYKDYKSNKISRDAMNDELSVLAKEQDAVKKEHQELKVKGEVNADIGGIANGIRAQNQHAFGTPPVSADAWDFIAQMNKGKAPSAMTGTTTDGFDYNGVNKTMDERINGEGGPAWTAEESAQYKAQGTTPVKGKTKKADDKGDKSKDPNILDKVGDYASDNPEVIAAGMAHVPSLVANIVNKKNIKAPDRIDPHKYRPSIKQTRFSVDGILNAMKSSTASNTYNLMNTDASYSEKTNSLMRINQANMGQMANAMQNKQQMEATEQSRVDRLVSDAMKFNTENENTADIDLAVRKKNYERDIANANNAIAGSAGGIFSEVSNALMAEKMGKWMNTQAKLNVDETPV